MKRLILSISILASIILAGILVIMFTQMQNDKLYGKLDMVIADYESGTDAGASLDSLESFAREYVKKLSYVCDEERLGELYEAVVTLKTLYYDRSEEFRTECARIRLLADVIYRRQIPSFGRLI